MTTVEVLRGTRAKVIQGWTRCTTARDSLGRPIAPLSTEASCWCLFGAAIAAGANIDERLAAYEVLRRFTSGVAVDAFNDLPDQTQEGVLAWLDLGIEAAESEAA